MRTISREFEKFETRLIGADVGAIKRGEDREVFKKIVEKIGGQSAKSRICHSMQDCLNAVVPFSRLPVNVSSPSAV